MLNIKKEIELIEEIIKKNKFLVEQQIYSQEQYEKAKIIHKALGMYKKSLQKNYYEQPKQTPITKTIWR